MTSFSDRHGFGDRPKISVRYEAPQELRDAVLTLALQARGDVMTCSSAILDIAPLKDFSPQLPIYAQATELLRRLPWNQVYDAIEAVWLAIRTKSKPAAIQYERLMNAFMVQKGIGWRLDGGQLHIRSEDGSDRLENEAATALSEAGFMTSSNEFAEAITDLSRRPEPDITGAVQHLGAGLECVMQEMCGDPKATLGKLLKEYPEALPTAVRDAVDKIWGYASEMGRHVREGRPPELAEAQLALHVASAAAAYLIEKRRPAK